MNIKCLLFMAIFYPFIVSAENKECISKNEAISLKNDFFSASENSDFLRKTATEKVAKQLDRYTFLLKNSSIIKKSTEIDFGWGSAQSLDMPSKTSQSFPAGSVCIWDVSFSLPENVRKMCDDDGAYGYFFNFRKIDGKLHLYSTLELIDSLSDTTLACEKMNEYLK